MTATPPTGSIPGQRAVDRSNSDSHLHKINTLFCIRLQAALSPTAVLHPPDHHHAAAQCSLVQHQEYNDQTRLSI